MTNYLEFYANEWLEAYVINNHGDPHKEFSELTGLDRAEAKEVCYKIIYSSDFLKYVMYNQP